MNKERLIEILEIPYADYTLELKKELTEYYKFIYGGKNCSSCKDKSKDYYILLSAEGVVQFENKTNLILTSESQFKLRSDIGVKSISFGEGLFISTDYTSDDLCIEFLRVNPNRISLFEIYPENWKDLINNVNDNDDEA